MTKEPLLDEIQQVRHAISEQINHDPRRIVEYYSKMQKEHAQCLVELERIRQASPESTEKISCE